MVGLLVGPRSVVGRSVGELVLVGWSVKGWWSVEWLGVSWSGGQLGIFLVGWLVGWLIGKCLVVG